VAHLLALIAAVSWAGVLHLLPLFVVVVVGGLKRGWGGACISGCPVGRQSIAVPGPAGAIKLALNSIN